MTVPKRIEDKKQIPCEKCGGTFSRLRSCFYNARMFVMSMQLFLGDLWTQELEDRLNEAETYFVAIECGDCGYTKALDWPADSKMVKSGEKNSGRGTESAAD